MDALSRLDVLGFDSLLHWTKTRNVTWNSASDCEALARSVAADPDDRRSRLALADGLRQLGRRDEADAILTPLPASDPEACTDAACSPSTAATMRGPSDGCPAVRRTTRAWPRSKACSHCGGADPGESAHQLRMALAADPNDRAVLSALATASRLLGDQPAPRLVSMRSGIMIA